MAKSLLSLLVGLTVMTSSFLLNLPTVSAENAKAAEIREILNSKTYYIEYEVNNKYDKHALAVDGQKRMSYDSDMRDNMSGGNFFSMSFNAGKIKLQREVLYDSHNYYQFLEKKKAIMATAQEMADPYINPTQEWDTVSRRVQLPDDFSMFTGDKNIRFVESGTKIVDKAKNKSVEFDKYVKPIKSVDGTDIAKTVYLVYYNDKGVLDKILSLTVNWNADAGTIFAANEDLKPHKRTYQIRTVTIKKLSKELPKDAVEIPKGCKIYDPGLGNMNELLDQPPLIAENK